MRMRGQFQAQVVRIQMDRFCLRRYVTGLVGGIHGCGIPVMPKRHFALSLYVPRCQRQSDLDLLRPRAID